MRQLLLVLTILVSAGNLCGQMNRSYNEDSLKAILQTTPLDTVRVNILLQLAGSYFFRQPDSCLLYAEEALALSRQLNYTLGIQNGLFRAGEADRQLGNVVEAIRIQLQALEFNRKVKNVHYEANALGHIGMCYYELHNYEEASRLLKEAVALRKSLDRREPTEALFNIYLAKIYTETNRPDSALHFIKEAGRAYNMVAQLRILRAINLGDIFFQLKRMDSANVYYKLALKYMVQDPENTPHHFSMLGAKLSEVFSRQNKPDSSLYFARYAYHIANRSKLKLRELESSRRLSEIFRSKGMLDSLVYYQDIWVDLNEKIFGKDKFREKELLLLQAERRSQEIQREEERNKNNLLLIGLVSIITVILIASILLFRSNRIKQKTNLVLKQTLNELKATQSQLIQSEKMASLGELTAGIAHEIQNPLNFVNNFSELNAELVEDLKKAVMSGDKQSAVEIANSIKDNQEKINQHGKRAEGIVTSMLQHSRTSSGQNELTDINALCDEYLRLTYHGYRAKDKSFNATFERQFDPSVPKLKVVPQDIGRVILNLLNNAAYAVTERNRNGIPGYTPLVKISTKYLGDSVELRIADNGMGIPESVKEKIFQPFFTTKPTGQGTGLGLSLAYDITKAHGGELTVETNEGSGAEFIIKLPI